MQSKHALYMKWMPQWSLAKLNPKFIQSNMDPSGHHIHAGFRIMQELKKLKKHPLCPALLSGMPASQHRLSSRAQFLACEAAPHLTSHHYFIWSLLSRSTGHECMLLPWNVDLYDLSSIFSPRTRRRAVYLCNKRKTSAPYSSCPGDHYCCGSCSLIWNWGQRFTPGEVQNE